MNNNADALKEYFKEDKNVMDTVNRLVFMKLSEMRKLEPAKKNRVCAFADEPIGVEELDSKACESMTYLELMCILRNSMCSSDYAFRYPGSDLHMESYENYLFYADALSQYLYDASDRSTAVRKFMLIPVKRMYEVFECEMMWEDMAEEYKKLKKIDDAGFDADNLTVKDVLDACREIGFKAWHPACSHPSEYIRNIKNAHTLEANLLIRSFAAKYPEAYDIDEVRIRYGNVPDICDDWEDVPDLWEDYIVDFDKHPTD